MIFITRKNYLAVAIELCVVTSSDSPVTNTLQCSPTSEKRKPLITETELNNSLFPNFVDNSFPESSL